MMRDNRTAYHWLVLPILAWISLGGVTVPTPDSAAVATIHDSGLHHVLTANPATDHAMKRHPAASDETVTACD